MAFSHALNSWRSWIIATACCIVYCLLIIVYRLSSLFYVELIEQYNIDRKSASIPFVVLGFVRCFSGLVYGILAERFGLQRMTFIGCYLSVLGMGLSYFAQDTITLTITLGLIYGFGFTATAILPNVIREHFDDSATSISNGFISIGPCITAIAFPAVIIYFIDAYGVSGSFLLTAGVILNAVPFTMMLKPRTKKQKVCKTAPKIEKSELSNNQDNILSNSKDSDTQNVMLNNKENLSNSHIVKEYENNNQKPLNGDKADSIIVTTFYVRKKTSRCSLHNEEGCPCINKSSAGYKYDVKKAHLQYDNNEISNQLANNIASTEKSKTSDISDSKHTVSQELKIINQKDNDNNNSSALMAERNKDKKKGFFYTLNVLKDPTFMALLIIQGLFAYTYHIWLTTMIDYSRDKGIDRSYEIYILTLTPVADFAGRISLTWVTDKGYLSIANFSALVYILLAVSSIVMAVAKDFAIMTLGLLIMQLAIGAFMCIYPRMSYEFIEKDKQAVSVASIGLLYAPLSFTVAPLIGYFRENLGSYDGLYYLMTVMNFACSLIVLLLPKLSNRRERRELKRSQNTTAFEMS